MRERDRHIHSSLPPSLPSSPDPPPQPLYCCLGVFTIPANVYSIIGRRLSLPSSPLLQLTCFFSPLLSPVWLFLLFVPLRLLAFFLLSSRSPHLPFSVRPILNPVSSFFFPVFWRPSVSRCVLSTKYMVLLSSCALHHPSFFPSACPRFPHPFLLLYVHLLSSLVQLSLCVFSPCVVSLPLFPLCPSFALVSCSFIRPLPVLFFRIVYCGRYCTHPSVLYLLPSS